jgi:hypothetical protein
VSGVGVRWWGNREGFVDVESTGLFHFVCGGHDKSVNSNGEVVGVKGRVGMAVRAVDSM